MAARVGTGVTGQGDGDSTTIASAAKSTTTGDLLTVWVKWEGNTANFSSIADTAGNTWTQITNITHTNGQLRGGLFYAANITGNAANVVTVTFSSVNAAYRRIIVEEWSGLALSSVEDQNEQTVNNGATSPFDTAAITTTSAGLVVLGVGAFGSLSSVAGAGTPTFSVAATVGDTTFGYLLSSSGQSVTPSITASGGGGADIEIAQAFKNAAVATSLVFPVRFDHMLVR
jgi:hypothetical protein